MIADANLPANITEQACIRPALPADIAPLLALEWTRQPHQRLARNQLRHLLTQGHALTLVDEFHGKIRGYILLLFRRDSRRSRIFNLTVHPSWQRSGVASGLLQAAEQAAHILQRPHLTVDITADNIRALQWFLGQGYRPCSEHPQDTRSGIGLYRLEKTLLSRPRPHTRRTQRWAFSLDNGASPSMPL
ncbi:N-acetyltransferase [Paludibacterium sp. B53371]|uniref:GNAT family N-acetyltransferase n=1 Tax=Paludibacterium sp. B53371 TaxID=2806263 RepID=UPI001C049AFB|nr:N-acetyltransferase [Paludibacterium sp. B53371]